MGIRHPPPLNDVSHLDNKRKMVGVAAALMLVLCFVPVPLMQVDYNYDFTFQEGDGTLVGPHFSHSIDKQVFNDWQNYSFPFRIENNGNMELDLRFNIDITTNVSGYECYAWLSQNGNTTGNVSQYFNTTLELGQTQNLSLNMMFSPMVNATQAIIDIEELEYPWMEANLNSESAGMAHGMRVAVNFT